MVCHVMNFNISPSNIGAFGDTESRLRASYNMIVLPPYTEGLMVIVFGYQVVWTIYSMVLLTQESAGGYLYYAPDFLPLILSIVFSGAMIMNGVWLFLWGSEKLVAEICILAVVAILSLIALCIALYELNYHGLELLQQDKASVVRNTRLLVHNGLQAYNTYTWFTFFSHLGLVLFTEGVLNKRDASTVALGLMAFFMILEAVLTIFVYDKYTRYLFATYLVQIWILACIVAYRFDASNRNTIIAIILLVLAIVLLLIKIYYVYYKSRENSEPLYLNKVIVEERVDGVITLPQAETCTQKRMRIMNMVNQPQPRQVCSKRVTYVNPNVEVFDVPREYSVNGCPGACGKRTTINIPPGAPIEMVNLPTTNIPTSTKYIIADSSILNARTIQNTTPYLTPSSNYTTTKIII